MRFKIRNQDKQFKHEEICTSVSWCSANEITRYKFIHLAWGRTMLFINGMQIPMRVPNGFNLTLMQETMIGSHIQKGPVIWLLLGMLMGALNFLPREASWIRVSMMHIRSQSLQSSGAMMELHLLHPVKMDP